MSDRTLFRRATPRQRPLITVAIAIAFPHLWTWALAVVWVVTMALSRTYLLVHWPTDVLAGAILGAATALLVSATVTAHAQGHPPSLPARLLSKSKVPARMETPIS
ncbi:MULTISPECIES: phosphatase PAP2 family protein [unclassified Cryobacterium]|uniref:phosphatase PAP2 family protein n=1 Tax=unclassified Cryobacterium TaxID=2649013 RepID=UPI000CE34DA5